MIEKILTREEVAVYLGLSSYQIDNLRKIYKMPYIKIGKSYRYKLDEVNNFIKKFNKKEKNE